MALNVALFVAGLVLAGMVLKDVFDTVVVPGGSRASLRVAHRLVFAMLPLWKWTRGRRRGLSNAFAPFVLVSCFVVWMILLAVGFGLMAFAFRADFQPPLKSVFDAIYVLGSSLVTVGLSQTNPVGTARWIALGGGFCGLAVMTMAVTYLLEVQQSVARRDTGIIKLNTSAGEPPSALALLERFAAIRNREALRDLLDEARTWCATVRQSHASHPSLIYFQSVGAGSGWPAALGAILDLALLIETCVDEERLFGPAILLAAEGRRMARELARVVGLKAKEHMPEEEAIRGVVKRLSDSGYAIRSDVDPMAVAGRRADYQSCVNALADHLGKPVAPLIP